MLHYLDSYELGHNYLELEKMINNLLIYIEKQLKEYKNNEKILKKYNWLKEYIKKSKPKYDSGYNFKEVF